jgi:SAM-dependent methyltransferase
MDPEYATRYFEYEKTHWWFRARRRVLKALLDHGIGWENVTRLLEIGSGSGANLAALYPEEVELTGIEPDGASADLARERGIATIHTGVLEDAPRLLGGESFEAITLFDVLEHVEDDRAALGILNGLLKPEGWLVLSVPAYQWLWSRHDDVNHHFRRYTRPMLVNRIAEAGFQVHTATYFNTVLFLPIVALRLLGKLGGGRGVRGSSDMDLPRAGLNELLYRIFAFESTLLRRIALPFGVSLFVLARREPAPGPVSTQSAIPALT